MKKYEHKFVKTDKGFHLNVDKKLQAMEKEWNELDTQNRRSCTRIDDAAIFLKKYKDKEVRLWNRN
ncbi:MAG: hypothetical protein Q4A75_07665 [Peptostreptococcaceae bacterium]|nr:hypothetical protein [Peptostreptococcaceae bacterium]